MACEEIDSWTFSALVGAYLDLAIAYLLLCASAFSFFAAKFLRFFGLGLPCPCNGLFGDPDGGKCLQRIVVHGPSARVSAVQRSVKSRSPFDAIWEPGDAEVKLLRDVDDDGCDDGPCERLTGREGQASCSSTADAWKFGGLGPEEPPIRERLLGVEKFGGSVGGRRVEVDGRVILSQKPPSGLRRRKRPGGGNGLSLHVGDRREEMSQESSVSSSSGEDQLQCDAESQPNLSLHEGMMLCTHHESVQQLNDGKAIDEDLNLGEERMHNFEACETGLDTNLAKKIKILEKALEKEQAARAALYLELERERNAAASATDEAMGMIHRLQKEKASIEMEARQFQRMIEEKSAYDEEEMNILKEILIRREREKLFMEKELEVFREMMVPSGGKADMPLKLSDKRSNHNDDLVEGLGQKPYSSLDSTDDPTLILQQISESIEKKGTVKDLKICLDNSPSGRKQGGFRIFPKELAAVEVIDTGEGSHLDALVHTSCSLDVQEKGIVSTDEDPSASQSNKELSTYNLMLDKEHSLDDATPSWAHEVANGLKPDNSATVDGFRVGNPRSPLAEIDSSVLDVHVVDDNSQICDKKIEERKGSSLKHSRSDVSNKWVDFEESIHRSNSDITGSMPMPDKPQRRASFSAFRRSSFSAVDNEKFKIETEVGWLTERLKLVQQGREKLNISIDTKEKQKLQELQLLEEISSQLQEIRSINLTGPNARRVSLPPPFSKAMSKKRRCRSASLHESTD